MKIENFSNHIKTEICQSLKLDEFNTKAFIFAIMKNIGEISLTNDVIEFKTQYSFLVKIIKCACLSLNLKYTILISNKKTLNNKTIFLIQIKHENLVNDINVFFNNLKYNEPYLNSILIATFLSSGSISNIDKNKYHLEIRINDENFKNIIWKIFEQYNIIPKLIFHKNKYVIYFKKAEYISDILKLFGAHESMFYLEEKRIEHDLVNNMQRLINLDVSNIKKTTKTCVEQLAKCKFLISDYKFNLLNEKEKLYCETRIKFPTYNMNEICNEMNKYLPKNLQITKGSLSHIMKKIRILYNSKIID